MHPYYGKLNSGVSTHSFNCTSVLHTFAKFPETNRLLKCILSKSAEYDNKYTFISKAELPITMST